MKRVERHKQFEKSFRKRIGSNKKLRAQFEARLRLFQSGQRNYPLNDHALAGLVAGKRAFSVTADIRVVYIEDDKRIIFLDIRTHNQVYK